MRLLLDTNVLLWALSAPERLPATTREQIESVEHTVFFSAASMWEIAIKAGLGRLDFAHSAADLLDAALEAGFEELPVRAHVALRVANLPAHHRDPFDRLLIAQAMSEPATFLTSDAFLARYTELVSIVLPR